MTLIIKRSFLGGRSMGDAVKAARDETRLLLIQQKLYMAAAAAHQSRSFNDFMKMRGAMLAWGLHCVRLRGGRGIDPNPPSWPKR